MPTKTSLVTSALVPAQLMAETLISRGMLYFPSRTTVVVLVVMDCVVVLVSILYSSTTSSSPDSKEMMMEKLLGRKSISNITFDGGDGKSVRRSYSYTYTHNNIFLISYLSL